MAINKNETVNITAQKEFVSVTVTVVDGEISKVTFTAEDSFAPSHMTWDHRNPVRNGGVLLRLMYQVIGELLAELEKQGLVDEIRS